MPTKINRIAGLKQAYDSATVDLLLDQIDPKQRQILHWYFEANYSLGKTAKLANVGDFFVKRVTQRQISRIRAQAEMLRRHNIRVDQLCPLHKVSYLQQFQLVDRSALDVYVSVPGFHSRGLRHFNLTQNQFTELFELKHGKLIQLVHSPLEISCPLKYSQRPARSPATTPSPLDDIAIKQMVWSRWSQLTIQEKQVLSGRSSGYTNYQLSQKLDLKMQQLDQIQLQAIQKLGLNRVDWHTARKWIREGLRHEKLIGTASGLRQLRC